MTWQPIDTAPKDGTWVLLWTGNECRIAMWDEWEDPECPVTQGWFDDGDGMYIENPTHWMPLPEAPDR